MTRIGDYELLGELGRGGMGAVFRAREVGSEREVALKIATGTFTSQRLARFQREGEITAGLRHPGILRVHTAGEADGRPYLVYQLVPGCRELDEAWEGLGREERVALVRDAARALGYAHSQGVVHRDVKPGNLLVDPSGRLRVADFGLAAGVGLERLTETGALVGTPHYLSPEQVGTGEPHGPGIDVWALGVLLYQALTDRLPFDGESMPELAGRILSGEVPPMPGAPRALEAVCRAALRLAPEQRYADAEEMADDIDAALSGDAISATGVRGARPPWRRALVVALGVLLACGAALFGWAARESSPALAATPLRIEVSSPEDGARLDEETVRVEGKVAQAASPAVWIRLGAYRRRVGVGERFSFDAPLRVGANALVLECVDDSGARREVRVEVERLRVPRWYSQRAQSARPALPLPDGVEFSTRGAFYVNVKDGSGLVWIPPATFMMGTPLDAAREVGEDDERPVHQVSLTRGYFMGRHEVTWAQFERFCAETGRTAPSREVGGVPAEDDHPVVNVTLPDARAYCSWAGGRLPTEAEWEYAARAGRKSVFPWGDETPLDGEVRCNLAGSRDGYAVLSPVGSFPSGASPWGCHDMCGNAEEWVDSAYTNSYPTGPVVDPKALVMERESWVVRGGSWRGGDLSDGVRSLRVGFRGRGRPALPNPEIGFRLAR